MRNLLGEDSFRREGLGVWDENVASSAIDPEQWSGTAVDLADWDCLFELDGPDGSTWYTRPCDAAGPDGKACVYMPSPGFQRRHLEGPDLGLLEDDGHQG